MNKAFLSVAETARIVGLGRSMTYRLLQEGTIPSVRLGKKRALRVPASSLERWISDRTADAEREKG